MRRGDIVVVESFDVPTPMIEALVDRIYAAAGHPVLWQKSWATLRALLRGYDAEALAFAADAELEQARRADVYIGIRASLNAQELAGVPPEALALFRTSWLGPVHYKHRVQQMRWCSTKWPTEETASGAGMTLREFEEFYFRACLGVDYPCMRAAIMPLAQLLETTDHVRVIAPGTDVTFSIKGMRAHVCSGEHNLPDGEVFTAPVKNSVEGVITYNVPASFQGETYEGVRLQFNQGRIVDFECLRGSETGLKHLFATDAGARFIGEFALGVNPMIGRPVNDTMFDEKMAGSIHLTPGNSYKVAYNGNESALHWDLVLSLIERAGGGQVYFDGALVSDAGRFSMPELRRLNPV